MDPIDEDIARLLRFKRYEQPPASYYENFLSEFRRRQRDELLRQPLGVFASNARTISRSSAMSVPWHPTAGIAVVVACAAVISITILSATRHIQVAVESSPVPTKSSNTEKELDFAPRVLIPTFNGRPTFLRSRRDIPLLPADPTSGPMNLFRSSSNGNHSTIDNCQEKWLRRAMAHQRASSRDCEPSAASCPLLKTQSCAFIMSSSFTVNGSGL